MQSGGSISVKIWRGAETGAFAAYSVEARQNQTVLDVVTEIQREQEPALAYRFACRVGVCGSCAMTVNGVPRWTCRTHVSKVHDGDHLTIEPLRSMPRVKDLVTDMTEFFEKWHDAGGRFERSAGRTDPPAAIEPDHPARIAANEAIECINCAVCYAACDVVAWDENYVGPAALNRAWTLVNDARHADRAATFDLATRAGGCGSCHSQGNCMKHCPVGLRPAESIAGLKRAALFGLPDVS